MIRAHLRTTVGEFDVVESMDQIRAQMIETQRLRTWTPPHDAMPPPDRAPLAFVRLHDERGREIWIRVDHIVTVSEVHE